MEPDKAIIQELEHIVGKPIPRIKELNYEKIGLLLDKKEKVISLNLKECKLSKVPDILLQLKSLQALDLSFNQLTALPESFSNLKSLRNLALGANQLINSPSVLKRSEVALKTIFI